MSVYEDELNQMLALSLIPAEELRRKATMDDGEGINKYELAKGLLQWFHGFFQWVNAPKCEQCGKEGKQSEEGGKNGIWDKFLNELSGSRGANRGRGPGRSGTG